MVNGTGGTMTRSRGAPKDLEGLETVVDTVETAEDVKSPPTPHKIQSLDERSLILDENDLALPVTPIRNGYHHPSKPLINTHQNKPRQLFGNHADSGPAENIKPGQNDVMCSGRRKTKLTDYFPMRRSQRKTKQVINEEKHQMLVKAITDEVEDGLQIRKFHGKGRGLVTTKRFLKNEFVVEYAGDLLTQAEAKIRESKYSKDTRAGCFMYYFQYNNIQYCVDATKETARFGRLLNHSRNGNLITKVVEVKEKPHLILIAKRDIEVDEELTYDYGDRSREALRSNPWLAY